VDGVVPPTPCHVTQANSHHEGTQNHCSFQAISSNFQNWENVDFNWKSHENSNWDEHMAPKCWLIGDFASWIGLFLPVTKLLSRKLPAMQIKICDILRLLLHYPAAQKIHQFWKKTCGCKDMFGHLENWCLEYCKNVEAKRVPLLLDHHFGKELGS